MEFWEQELEKLGLRAGAVELIRDNNEVAVARVVCEGAPLILKTFRKRKFRREIDNYAILSSLGVPTLKLVDATDSSLLMEDILAGPYRLGTEADLDDTRTAALLAGWYRTLHERGHAYVENCGAALYDENDVLTPENLERLKARTATARLPVWRLIERSWDTIKASIDCARRTLTYNDFYFTNLAVARDGSGALMFDYNLLGKGYAYADIRNVRSSLSGRAGAAFLAAYGAFDEHEAEIDAVAGVLVSLHLAYERERPPAWAGPLLEELRGALYGHVERLIGG